MAFTINLYNNSSEPEVVDKSLSLQTSLQGQLKDMVSIKEPTILINANSIPDANYMYIPDFHRYYYITDKNLFRTNLVELHTHCDPLMSFKSGIRACNALVERQEYNYNPYLVDNLYPMDNKNTVSSKKLKGNYGFKHNNIVLTYSTAIEYNKE